MTDAELVTAGSKLYDQILAISFGNEEMLALGEAILSKTPWAVLTPAAKIASFRLADAILPADTELVTAGRRLYHQILAIPFGRDEMLEFGQAVFSKTPWSALTPTAKVATFRIAAALEPPSESRAAVGTIPDAEIIDKTEESLAELGPPDQAPDASIDSDPNDAKDREISATDDAGTGESSAPNETAGK